jgi:hypothetical protein
VQFYLCPEQGIIKVQYNVQFYLCPEQGIFKSAMLASFLLQEWMKVEHFTF